MTKQERIMIGMAIRLSNFLLAVEGGRLSGTQLECERTAKDIFNFLHSQGVVIKVGWEEDTPYGDGCSECPLAIAVEPLI